MQVVAGPTSAGEVVLASVTTLRPSTFDRTIILDVGDHPFLRHPSAVACGFATIALLADLQVRLDQRTLKPKEPLREDLVAKIRTGLVKPDFTPNGVKHLLKELAAAT